MGEGAALYSRWLARTAAVATPSLRFGLWCEALKTYPPEHGAGLIDFVARQARRSGEGRSVYQPLLNRAGIIEAVGPANLYDVAEAAQTLDLRGAQLALYSGTAPESVYEAEHEPDPLLDQLSLGHKKTLARGTRSPSMERLLKSAAPEVVRQVLRNPRLREEEVVAIASRRPASAEVFGYLAAAPQWIARPAVQRAVVFNPYAPPSLVLCLLVCLRANELEEVHKDEKLHPEARDGAFEVLSWQ